MVDQGRFEIRIGGVSRGQESFAIRRQGEEHMAVGRTSLEGEELWVQSAEIGLRTNARLDPIRYEFRTLQQPRETIIAVRTGSRIKVTTSDVEGERMTELRADRRLVLLQPGVAHHYWFLVSRLAAASPGGTGTLDVLAPGTVQLAPAHLERTSDVELAFAEGPARQAVRYDVRIGESDHVIWVERGSGRVLRAEIPERAWVAVRHFESGGDEPEDGTGNSGEAGS